MEKRTGIVGAWAAERQKVRQQNGSLVSLYV